MLSKQQHTTRKYLHYNTPGWSTGLSEKEWLADLNNFMTLFFDSLNHLNSIE